MHAHAPRIARLAWLFTFVIPLILAALLLGVKSSQAASPAPGVVPLAFEEELAFDEEDELEEDEAEFAEAECEIAEEEAIEGEISEAQAEKICEEAEDLAKSAGPSSTAANRCPLRSAHTRAVVRHERLKLTIGYTTTSSTPATIEIRAGNRRIATVHRHLGRSGVLRISRKLGKRRINRITASFKTPSCKPFRTSSTKVG
jgi:hypothetical protein